MSPRQQRFIQLALVAMLVAVGAAVSLTLRSPSESPPPPEASLQPGQANTTRTGDLVYRIYREGQESLALSAKRMEGSEKEELLFHDVALAFTYKAQGEPGRGTITADQCRYAPGAQRASFRGHVIVQTADGFELETELLNYRSDRGVARTDRPVTFKRKDMSGSATGVIYHVETGTVEMQSDVVVLLRDPDQVPGEIRSQRALLKKDKGSIEFQGGVRVLQGGDTLTADAYVVEFVKETRAFRRASAYGSVVLTLRAGSGGGAVPGMAPPSLHKSGPRVLRAPKLDLWFRPDRSLEEVSAGPGAELRLMPGPGAPEGPRTLRARVLVFRMDGQGRLSEVQGQKESGFRSEPPAGSSAPPLEGTCRAFVARLEPQSGEVQEIDFMRDVLFTRGTQQASGGRGRFTADGWLKLQRKPELQDAARRMSLSAQSLQMQTRTGDLGAQGGVRHVVQAQPSAEAAGGLLSGGAATTLVAAETFAYDQAQRVTRYSGEALMRSGGDEIRAPKLTLSEPTSGKRLLTAEDGVVSRLQPQTGKPAPAGRESERGIEARAKVMIFDEGSGKIAYRQDVVLRQGRLVLRSPRADLTLTADGRGLRTLVAGEPVEMIEGDRKVVGQRATYTPADEKIVVEGDKVLLTGPGQAAQGRTLTLHVGDDRIVVDGREESRTETVFRKEPPKP